MQTVHHACPAATGDVGTQVEVGRPLRRKRRRASRPSPLNADRREPLRPTHRSLGPFDCIRFPLPHSLSLLRVDPSNRRVDHQEKKHTRAAILDLVGTVVNLLLATSFVE